MAWRNIRLYYLHAARVAGSANITSNVSFTTSKDFLVDDRGSSICRLASGTGNYIQLDRLTPSTNINKLYIPAGHELNGCTIRLESDDNSGFSSPTTMLAATAISGSAAINYDVTASGERYVRLTFETAGVWGLGELYLSQQRAPARGPEHRWKDQYVYPSQVFEKRTGARPAAEFGSRLRELGFSFARIDSTDLVYWKLLEATVGLTRPFLLDAPFDTGGTIWCSLLSPLDFEFDSGNPQAEANPIYRFSAEIREWAA